MTSWAMSRLAEPLVFLDLETAGGDARRHPIIQIAAVAVDAHLIVQDELELKLQFDPRLATQASLRKAHYRPAIWRHDAVPPLVGARRLARFLRQQSAHGSRHRQPLLQLVAHHANYDGPFLQAWFRRQEVYLPAHPQLLCTLQRIRWFFAEHPKLPPPASFRLASLCHYFEIPFHAAEAHDALADARATLALYRRLTERRHQKIAAAPSSAPDGHGFCNGSRRMSPAGSKGRTIRRR